MSNPYTLKGSEDSTLYIVCHYAGSQRDKMLTQKEKSEESPSWNYLFFIILKSLFQVYEIAFCNV